MLATAACILIAVGVTQFLAKRPIENASTTILQAPATHAVAPSDGAHSVPSVPINQQTILLVAERLRGEQQITTHHIRPDVPVQIQVLLPQQTAHAGYTLTVSSLDDTRHVLVEQKHLQAQLTKGQPYLSIMFAPGSLPAGRYRAYVNRGGDTVVSQFTVEQ
jgi:hypothetical protein